LALEETPRLPDFIEDKERWIPEESSEIASLSGRIRRGDRSAEDELVTRYRRKVFLIAAARTRDREVAHDLAQDVLIAVLKALRDGQLEDFSKLNAFVQGTTRNIVSNYLRSQWRRSECNLQDAEHVARIDPTLEHEAADRRRLVQSVLKTFNPTDQQILLLSIIHGHTLSEVAGRLKLSHDVVRARKSRMLRKLTEKFSQMSQKR